MVNFSIGEAVSYGWGMAKKNIGFFFQLLLLLFVIMLVLQVLAGALVFLAPIVSIVIQTILGMGMITIVLKFVDGKQPALKDLWGTYKPFWVYLGASILVGLGVFVGTLVFIIPGIILALGWMFFSYLIVDKGLGVTDAMKRSWEITKGQRWQLLGLAVALWFINVLGAIPLGIGLFWTMPTSMMAMAYTYRKLEGSAGVMTSDKAPVKKKASPKKKALPKKSK